MTPEQHVPALIVGAGPIGLACAISARRRGIQHLVVDAGPIANSIVRYPIGMGFFTTPERLEIGDHPLVTSSAKATREEALKYYRGVVRAEQLSVQTFTRFEGATRRGERLHCQVMSTRGEALLTCDRLVIATGYFDHPNLLDVPGENLPHVSHWFDESHRTTGRDVVVIGGKNSSVETALACYRAGARVTLVYRRAEFRPSVKYWLKPDIENRIKANEITARFATAVTEILPHAVRIRSPERGEELIPADHVYALTGYHPDFNMLTRLGVDLDAESQRPTLDPQTLQTNVPGIHLAGSVACGRQISEVFIENGRFDGEKIFGDVKSREWAEQRYAESPRPEGE